MYQVPRSPVQSESDATLAAHHVRSLTFLELRAAAAAALSVTDDDLARLLVVAPDTARGQAGRAERKVFALLELKGTRTLLGRWIMFHWDCCGRPVRDAYQRGALFTRWAPAEKPPPNRQRNPYFDGPKIAILVSTGVAIAGLAMAATAIAMAGLADPSERTAPEATMAAAQVETERAAPSAPALPATQAAYLADGKVTYEELEEATANYLGCMASRGYAAAPLQGEGLRPTVPLYTLPDSEGHDTNAVVRAAQTTAQHCRLQHLDEVQAAYAAAHLRPSKSEIEQIYAWMEDCAAEGGPGPIDLPERAGMLYLHYFDAPSMNLTIAIEQADTWRACNWALQAETGFIAPPPPVRSRS